MADLVVAVTGGTGGIGRAIARAIVEQGGLVALGCHPQELDEGYDFARGLDPVRVAAFAVNVTSLTETRAFAAAASERFGAVDALVNNAGIMEQVAFDDLGEDLWSRTLAVNLTGAYNMTKAMLTYLRKSRRASIVNMSSQMAYGGGAGAAAYCASKAGLLGLTRALAHDLSPIVRVNAVAPGPIESPMTQPHMADEWNEMKSRKLVMHRFGQPREVATAVRFLLSDDASFFTGQTLSPNGGGVMP